MGDCLTNRLTFVYERLTEQHQVWGERYPVEMSFTSCVLLMNSAPCSHSGVTDPLVISARIPHGSGARRR
jgi:hypothetical protein